MATAITKSLSGTITTYTVSVWVKKFVKGGLEYIFNAGSGGLAFTADKMKFQSSGTPTSTRMFRDPSAWYHVCVSCSSGTSTLYINGVSVLTSGSDCSMSSNIYVGGYDSTPEYPFIGLMSHFHFIDGTAYAPTDFASTDSTSGIWKPSTGPNVTYGTNGFFLKMEDSSNMDLDSSSNSHTMTTIGTGVTATKDNPSNNFCTLNPAYRYSGTLTNALTYTNGASWVGLPGTMAVEKGKWYWEIKLTAITNWTQNGIASAKQDGGYNSLHAIHVGGNNGAASLNTGGGDIYYNGSSSGGTWFGSGNSQGEIIGVALDVDNGKLYFSSNNSWGNSSNPATNTNGYALPSNITDNLPIVPAASVQNCTVDYNFGNGYFGTTAVSSAESDGAGYGAFEYAPPSGFYALCTKNLAEYG